MATTIKKIIVTPKFTATKTPIHIPGIKTPLTGGWWIFIGVFGAILISGTPLAPLALGIMSVALLYQVEQLIKGK